MITQDRAKHCITHYYACDCREYKAEQMERALKVIATWSNMSPGRDMADIHKAAADALNCLKELGE